MRRLFTTQFTNCRSQIHDQIQLLKFYHHFIQLHSHCFVHQKDHDRTSHLHFQNYSIVLFYMISVIAFFGPIPLNPLVNPPSHILHNKISILIGLTLYQRMVHALVHLQALVLTRGFLKQQLWWCRACHPISRAVDCQERRCNLGEIVLYVLAHPSNFPHGSHPRLACVSPRVGCYDLEFLWVLDRFAYHFVVWHGCPRISQSKEQAIHE